MDFNLDPDNPEFNNAADLVRKTSNLIYLTGKAGTGKTVFLKHIKETTKKNTVIVAPTGVAAINAGGVTINSFFQIPFGPFMPNDPRLNIKASRSGKKESIFSTFKYGSEKKDIIRNLDLLIIDEVSMLRADKLDVIDKILKAFRHNNEPFGGVQVLLIGDTFQLPPIAKDDEWDILSKFYATTFFFSSKVMAMNPPLYIELKKIYRQDETLDGEFIDLLNKVRENTVTDEDMELLNSKHNPSFDTSGQKCTVLATHKYVVKSTNATKLNQLPGDFHSFEAIVTGNFPESSMPTEEVLNLKVGAQIMFVKNDSSADKNYYNGRIGEITGIDNDSLSVELEDGPIIEVVKENWENTRYTYKEEEEEIEIKEVTEDGKVVIKKGKRIVGKIVEEVIGSFMQFPVRLAWAITVHKSQGLTLKKVFADLGTAFAPGQIYVALSRCTSFSGLVLKTRIGRDAIKTAPEVLEFARTKTPRPFIEKQLTQTSLPINIGVIDAEVISAEIVEVEEPEIAKQIPPKKGSPEEAKMLEQLNALSKALGVKLLPAEPVKEVE